MDTTTPTTINQHVLRLCSQITRGTPFYVPVRPDNLAETQQCFQNVISKVERQGGTRIDGWRIWERPSLYIEAEYHAIWQSSEGETIDITPLPDGEATMLFLPDKTRPYKGRQRDTVRLAIADSHPLQNIFAAKEKQFRILNRGARARTADGSIALRGVELAEYERTEQRIAVAEMMFKRGLDDKSKCLCNSGRT